MDKIFRITEEQLDENIALCKKKHNVDLKRTVALSQLNRLVSLVLYLTFSDKEIKEIEKMKESL